MDDLNFNVDDIINDVNAKIKSAEKNEADEESVEAKSEPNNPYRTGQIVGVCKDFQLFVDKPEFIIKTENGVSYCFVEENVGKQIGFFK